MKKSLPFLLILSLAQTATFAHGGDASEKPHNVHELLRSWEFDPLVVFGLALSAWIYVRGLRRLWRATRIGRTKTICTRS